MHITHRLLSLVYVLSAVGCASTSTSTSSSSLSYCTKYPSVSDCEEVLIGNDNDIWKAASRHSSNGDHAAAWALLTLTPPNHTEKTLRYLRQNPSVYEAGREYFLPESLRLTRERSAGTSVAYHNLESFSRLATADDAAWASENVENILGPPGTLPQRKSSAAPASYGRVTDVQIENRSTAGSSAGTSLGSLVGQTSYIDRTSYQGYSATGQVVAGLIGGLIGSSLDSAPQVDYQLKYWIKTNSGETISVDRTGATQTHIPIGTCVEVKSFTVSVANERMCP